MSEAVLKLVINLRLVSFKIRIDKPLHYHIS